MNRNRKNFLFQYSVFKGKLPMKRHAMTEEQARGFLGIYAASRIAGLKEGTTSVVAIPVEGHPGWHVNIVFRDPNEITCKRCSYSVYGLLPQLKRMSGRGHLGHGLPKIMKGEEDE